MELSTCIFRAAVGSFLFYLILGQTCERYWLLHDDTCFRHFTDQVSYYEAKWQCSIAHAQLVTNSTNSLELRLLGPNEQHEDASYWCHTESDEGDDPFAFPMIDPQRKRRSADCCVIRNTEKEMGECDESRRYICEKGPISLIDVCLQNTSVSSNASDWEAARRYCQCNGGDLYSFNDTSEAEHFLQFARVRNRSMWIGLRREADSNEFLWSDGMPFSYSTWTAGELSTDDNSKLCVAYVVKNSSWEVVDCNSQLSFTCKLRRKFYDLSYEGSTSFSELYNVSYEDSTSFSELYNVSDEESTSFSELYNVSYEESPTEKTTFHMTYDNTTTETTYVSPCHPLFEKCYVGGVVLGLIVLLIVTATAVAYFKLRTKKEKVEEIPVQLLDVRSYQQDIPAKKELTK